MESIIEVDPAGHYSYFIEIGIVRIKGVNTRPNVSNLPEVPRHVVLPVGNACYMPNRSAFICPLK